VWSGFVVWSPSAVGVFCHPGLRCGGSACIELLEGCATERHSGMIREPGGHGWPDVNGLCGCDGPGAVGAVLLG
jgi:hypothetical protein